MPIGNKKTIEMTKIRQLKCHLQFSHFAFILWRVNNCDLLVAITTTTFFFPTVFLKFIAHFVCVGIFYQNKYLIVPNETKQQYFHIIFIVNFQLQKKANKVQNNRFLFFENKKKSNNYHCYYCKRPVCD